MELTIESTPECTACDTEDLAFISTDLKTDKYRCMQCGKIIYVVEDRSNPHEEDDEE